MAGCSGGNDSSSATATTKGASSSTTSTTTGATTTTGAATTAVTDCTVIPEETGGPFPGDGSNGPDVLAENGVVRKDIRSSFDGVERHRRRRAATRSRSRSSTSTTAASRLTGAAVYVWHCDREGNYSMYQQARATRTTCAACRRSTPTASSTFTSIFPACYSGRWPHVHFEVYPSVDAATSGSNKLVTSQLAFPKDVVRRGVRDRAGTSTSASNLSRVSLDSDMVFSDGVATRRRR